MYKERYSNIICEEHHMVLEKSKGKYIRFNFWDKYLPIYHIEPTGLVV